MALVVLMKQCGMARQIIEDADFDAERHVLESEPETAEQSSPVESPKKRGRTAKSAEAE